MMDLFGYAHLFTFFWDEKKNRVGQVLRKEYRITTLIAPESQLRNGTREPVKEWYQRTA